MHNLHFITVKAEDAEDAIGVAETYIEDWGNENNWRTICGCVSEDNKVHNCGDGRFSPKDTGYTTIKKINKCIQGWLKGNLYSQPAEEKIKKGDVDFEKWDGQDLFSLRKYAEFLEQKNEIGIADIKEFDVLKHTYYSGQYDECGVTNCDYDGEKTFVVFLDIHS